MEKNKYFIRVILLTLKLLKEHFKSIQKFLKRTKIFTKFQMISRDLKKSFMSM